MFYSKIIEHTVCDYSLFTHCSLDSSKSKHGFYRGAGCMKRFYTDFKKYTTEISIMRKRK